MNKEQNFYWWFEERLNYTKNKHSYHTWRNLDAAYRKMKAFRAELMVAEVTYKLLKDFEVFLISDGLSINTVGETLTRVRVITNELLKAQVISNNPFFRFGIDFTRTEKPRIDIEDIKKLEMVNLFGDAEVARDMYVLSFYCAGIRFGDLCRIKKNMIHNGLLCYTMHKSQKSKYPKKRRIKLFPGALRIAFKYSGEYIFDTKVKWSDDKTLEDKSINSRNAVYNKHLKTACEAAGVIDLSFHTSRNSFADHAKRKKLDVHTLKDLFGHSKISTTEIYMQDFYEEESNEAMDQLFG